MLSAYGSQILYIFFPRFFFFTSYRIVRDKFSQYFVYVFTLEVTTVVFLFIFKYLLKKQLLSIRKSLNTINTRYLMLKLFQNSLSLSRLNALRVGTVVCPFYKTSVNALYNSLKYKGIFGDWVTLFKPISRSLWVPVNLQSVFLDSERLENEILLNFLIYFKGLLFTKPLTR